MKKVHARRKMKNPENKGEIEKDEIRNRGITQRGKKYPV
jgi:hypothetical protein